jgi:hypothetical protein
MFSFLLPRNKFPTNLATENNTIYYLAVSVGEELRPRFAESLARLKLGCQPRLRPHPGLRVLRVSSIHFLMVVGLSPHFLFSHPLSDQRPSSSPSYLALSKFQS